MSHVNQKQFEAMRLRGEDTSWGGAEGVIIDPLCVGVMLGELEHPRLIKANQTAYRLLEISPFVLLNDSRWFERFLDPISYAELLEALDLSREARRGQFEFRLNFTDGRARWVRMEFQVVWLVRMLYTLYDITSQKEAEAQVAASEARYRALSDATTEGIFISLEGRCVDANNAASRLTGYSHEELIGIFGTDLMAPESRALVRHNMLEGTEIPYEAVAMRKDGARFPCELEGRMFERGGVRLRATAMRDITQRRKLERAALQSEKLRAIGTLTGGIAHDFNNLLAIINGEAELLSLDEGLSPEIRAAIELIREAGLRGARLTRHLLAFSRGEERADPRGLDLNQLIQSVFKLLQRLLPEDIELIFDLTSGLSPIYADPDQIEQILMNLVVNARDALAERDEGGEAKRILIETAEVRLDEDSEAPPPRSVTPCGPRAGTHIALSISDNGIGLDPEIATRIFEPFFSGKSIHKGTGLGLSTVYGIVTKAGGAIQIDSAPGRGLRVEILWPICAVSELEVEPASEPVYLSAEAGERVLLAEDDLELRRVTRDALTLHGYTVLTPEDAREALGQIRRGVDYDILISDVVMPEVSGWILAEESLARFPQRAVLLISGYTFEQNEARGVERLGAILPKPYALADLLAEVRRRLDAAKAAVDVP